MNQNQNFEMFQYAPPRGHTLLLQELCTRYTQLLHQTIHSTQFLITAGASEALACAMLSLLNPDDEIILLEPAFDLYIAQAQFCGAKLKAVPLRPKNGKWTLDFSEFEKAFTQQTKILVLNTPHNPTGMVFTEQQLQQIAKIIQKFPKVVVLCDEVYEYLIFENHVHRTLASIPEVADRCLIISSAGKTFSCTGFKIGWCVSTNPELVKCVSIAHQWILFSVSTPLQWAIGKTMQKAQEPFEGYSNYYEWFRVEYTRKRDILAKALREANIEPILPEGSFFIVGDTSKLKVPSKYHDDSVTRDWRLCRWLTVEYGVTAIPPSAFYLEEHKNEAENYARFAFCKPDEVLREAAKRLQKLKRDQEMI